MVDMLQGRAERQLRAAFRGLGAVTPGNARPGKEFPLGDRATFDNLLRRGIIREGAPGTFYLYEPPPLPRRWARMMLFWIAVVGIPVGIIQYCPGSP